MQKTCNLCGNPLHKILMGPRKIALYVHKGKDVDTCTAFKLDRNLMKELATVMKNVSKLGKVEIQKNSKGDPIIFGEPENPNA